MNGSYREFPPYSGMPKVVRPDGLYSSQQRFSLYRWHIADPIRFQSDLRVTIQALGWRSGGRYLPCRTIFPPSPSGIRRCRTPPFPVLPDKDARKSFEAVCGPSITARQRNRISAQDRPQGSG